MDKTIKTALYSAQNVIPIDHMFADGTARTTGWLYSRTIVFCDVNYELLSDDDKEAIFSEWCNFLNAFDSDVRYQFTFFNRKSDDKAAGKRLDIEPQEDGFDDIRKEYSDVLRNQATHGNSMAKTMYLTFAIRDVSASKAIIRLMSIQSDLIDGFRQLGIEARALNAEQRVQLIYEMLHIDENIPGRFKVPWAPIKNEDVRDYIAPSQIEFPNGKSFKEEQLYESVSYLQITASNLNDHVLKDFLELNTSEVVTMHIQAVDRDKALKMIKHAVTEIDRSKIDEQKRAVRSGYDYDIISADLTQYGVDSKAILKALENDDERMFMVTVLVLNTGKTKALLQNHIRSASGIAQKHNCTLKRLNYQQEEGMVSSLPLALNQTGIERALLTSSTAIFMPFSTQELFQINGGAFYYGVNALSDNLIMCNRKLLKNPNGLILGTPGSGKSFAAKREITNAFLATDDDIIICDPEGEYSPLVMRMNGQIIKISPNSKQYINPMDINTNYSEDDDPVALKADFILSLCEQIIGGKDGLQPVEKTVIDRCVHNVYREYFRNPIPERMPILENLYNDLMTQDEPEAKHVASALEIYVKGSLNLFNHKTNVDINNRLVCYDIKEIGKQLKKLGMLIVQDQVWGRVTKNRQSGKTTRYYMDEFHLLLKDQQTASFSGEIWKRFRKWGGIPTGITQNVKDLLASREVEDIFENTDFIYMLNQASGDQKILADTLGISPQQMAYVTHSGEGEGLLMYGGVILPFADRFPKNTELYKIMTTKPSDLKEVRDGS